MARSDMRDFEWDFIEKLLPNKSRDVKRVDDRRVINGILYALRTGIPWRDMPEQYGPWSTIYNRFNRWSKAGIWDMIFEAIVDFHNVDTVMVDSTSVRAHPTAAKLKKTDKRRCLGRSRGGLGTKIHASNNQDGLPLKLELTPNQANDAPPCGTLLTGLQPTSGCVRLTDVSVVGESPTERKGSHHFHREPCACHREVSGEASVAACAGQAIEPRNRLCRMRRDFPGNRRQHFSAAFG